MAESHKQVSPYSPHISLRRWLSAAAVGIIGFALVMCFAPTAHATTGTPHCGKIANTGNGSWKWDCNVRFSNGPNVKIRFTQNGQTVAVRGCAYGRKPKGYQGITLSSEINIAAGTTAEPLTIRRTGCTVSRQPVLTTYTVPHGTKVTATATLFWGNHQLSPQATYTVA